MAGGTENMSRAPYLLPGARWGERLGNGTVLDHMIHEGLTDAFHDIHMGVTAENLVERYGITRADQDAFAAESQRRAEAAIRPAPSRTRSCPSPSPARRARRRFDTDEHPRAGHHRRVARQAQAGVQEGRHRHRRQRERDQRRGGRAGGGRRRARAEPRRCRRSRASCPTPRRRWTRRSWGSAPCPRCARRSRRPRSPLDAIDLFELNEAFAAQSLAVLRELKLDPLKVNVLGGAIALGPSHRGSGARILVTLIHALRARDLRYGVAALCIGGGQGVAMVVERLPDSG